jgi:hypothetical protein
MRWWLAEEMPTTEIRGATISVRVFLPPDPKSDGPRPGPVLVPLAQWTPDALAPYDPVAGRFAD